MSPWWIAGGAGLYILVTKTFTWALVRFMESHTPRPIAHYEHPSVEDKYEAFWRYPDAKA